MGPIMAALTKAGPWFVKQSPRLWPLLVDGKNREYLLAAVNGLASQSPAKRLRSQVELTAAIADNMASEAASEKDSELARTWSQQARNLLLRLDMPIAAGRKEKRTHMKSVRAQLANLQREMDSHLEGATGASTEPQAELP